MQRTLLRLGLLLALGLIVALLMSDVATACTTSDRSDSRAVIVSRLGEPAGAGGLACGAAAAMLVPHAEAQSSALGAQSNPAGTADGAGSAALTSAPTTNNMVDQCPPGTADASSRFGVVVVGSTPDVPAALLALGATTWFRFDRSEPGAAQVAVVRPSDPLPDVARRARAAPGGTWLIGNEPNVPGQDDMTPEAYADFLAGMTRTIREADPSALLVGPNVLNWDDTCTSCPGYPSGRDWADRFLRAYQTRYGPLPFNAWGMHTYGLNWERLPMVNASADQAQLTSARAWLDAQGLSLPIWLTEFGVVWGFDGVAWVDRPDGSYVAEPRGAFRADMIDDYLDAMLRWLTGPGTAARVERWFIYGTNPAPEPFASALAGIALFEPNALILTRFGERYRAWATICTVSVSGG